MRFREGFYRFMQGRNGADAYGKALNGAGLAALLLAIVFTLFSRGLAGKNETASLVFFILYLLAYVVCLGLMGYHLFRMFSRKVSLRQAENTRFLYRQNRRRRKIEGWKQQWRERKTHRYFRCPKCRQKMRAPRNKGKIRVTCSKCREVFVKKT